MNEYYKALIKHWTKVLKHETDPKLRQVIKEGIKDFKLNLKR